MSYRIKFGKISLEKLNKEIDNYKKAKDDDKWEIFSKYTDLELCDNLEIYRFNIVEGQESKEYPTYVITKKEFFGILQYYQKLLYEVMKENSKKLDVMCEKKTIGVAMSGIQAHFTYLEHYFERLIRDNSLITSSGLFLIDYFYLVEIYKNWKKGERGIITHG